MTRNMLVRTAHIVGLIAALSSGLAETASAADAFERIESGSFHHEWELRAGWHSDGAYVFRGREIWEERHSMIERGPGYEIGESRGNYEKREWERRFEYPSSGRSTGPSQSAFGAARRTTSRSTWPN